MLRLLLRLVGLLALGVLVSCGLPTERSAGEPGSGFPHADNWRWEHGPNGRANAEACTVCHDAEAEEDVDYRGGERLPPCNGCHDWPLEERPEDLGPAAAVEPQPLPWSRG